MKDARSLQRSYAARRKQLRGECQNILDTLSGGTMDAKDITAEQLEYVRKCAANAAQYASEMSAYRNALVTD